MHPEEFSSTRINKNTGCQASNDFVLWRAWAAAPRLLSVQHWNWLVCWKTVTQSNGEKLAVWVLLQEVSIVPLKLVTKLENQRKNNADEIFLDALRAATQAAVSQWSHWLLLYGWISEGKCLSEGGWMVDLFVEHPMNNKWWPRNDFDLARAICLLNGKMLSGLVCGVSLCC